MQPWMSSAVKLHWGWAGKAFSLQQGRWQRRQHQLSISTCGIPVPQGVMFTAWCCARLHLELSLRTALYIITQVNDPQTQRMHTHQG